jgi:hypothetical protein
MEQKFDAAFIGLNIKNGEYVANLDPNNGAPADAILAIKGNKTFTIDSTLKIVKEINSYLPNLSTGVFKIKVDGIKFKCELAMR